MEKNITTTVDAGSMFCLPPSYFPKLKVRGGSFIREEFALGKDELRVNVKGKSSSTGLRFK